MWKGTILTLAGASMAAIAAAQTDDALPGHLSGHWTLVGNRTSVNAVSFDFEGSGKPGALGGKVTWRGVGCGAQNEPLTGTWDGRELRINMVLRANVNADRMKADCGDGKTTVVLTRKAGEKSFEGDARASYTPAVPSVTVSPQ
jgi:hypothetical protein